MRRDVEVSLVRRILDHVAADTRDLAPDLVRRPVSDYLDPGRFAAEQQALFRDHPVVVGHLAQLPTPDSWFTHDVAGVPILVTRTEAGRPQAFVNVCRHRGARVAGEACGRARRLTCPFHGWSYDLEGRLRGVPLADGFDTLDRDGHGLVRLATDERHGLIFVRPRVGGPPIDLDVIVGGMSAELAEHRPERHLLASRQWTVECNWKVLLDNFLEVYHLPVLHSSNIGPMFEPNRVLFDDFGQNGRRIDPRTSIRALADRPEDEWRLRDHALVTYFVFPNVQTFWTQDYFSWLAVWPLAVDRTICSQILVADWEADSPERRARLGTNLDLFDMTLAEDFGISADVQRGLGSGAVEEILFGRHEHGAAVVHATIDEALARWRAGEPVDAWSPVAIGEPR
jgi:phenylpropionate dioxygenase-like ring-hydroxylating dioxygenase large terminal subunit